MPKVTYFQEGVTAEASPGQTLLEVSIERRIPHLQQCGGNARCTTCRVQVLDGLFNLSPPNPVEQGVATQRGWDAFTRLACQSRVQGDVVIRRLLTDASEVVALDLDELAGRALGAGEELDLAVLFSDIRDFTTYSEQNLPHDVVHMLNRYFTAAVEPVLTNNGFIDKYIGDGLLAVFGVRDKTPEQICKNAVRAALGMLAAAERLSVAFAHEFCVPLRIGIGVHFGPAILGRIGHPKKRQLTVIGDTVNTASRIESMTKPMGVSLLLSDAIVSRLPGMLKLGPPKEVLLKGKAACTLLYPCFGFTESDPTLLVQSSFADITLREQEFGERFYENLFAQHPELRPLFRTDLTEQCKMLMSIWNTVVKGLGHRPEVADGLTALGRRHLKYGIEVGDYDKLRGVLLITLEQFLGEGFTPELRQAWTTLYETMVQAMLR